MTGRHAMNRDVALSALNSPAGRGLAAAMAVGTMFGVALPTASADEGATTNAFGGPVTDLSTANTTESTTEVTAPEDASWQLEQVEVQDGNSVQSVSTIEAEVEAPAPQVEETKAATEDTSDAAAASSESGSEASQSAASQATAQQEVVNTSAAAPSAQSQQAAAAQQREATAPVAASSGNGSAVLNTALSYVGTPYRWGGTTPSGWDCIGFVRYVYGQYGVNIGGYTTSVLSVGTRVPYSQAQPGDILYWPGHVGIYAGNGQNVGAWNASMGTKVGPNSWVGGTPTVIRVF
ncbi:MAG: NlpC/P60 family protein [Actinomycetaceae bacterium]|nr:NlpC/P60 family protein [Actinomycetaceae bacterium]